MKLMTRDEFDRRSKQVQEALRVFGHMTDHDLTKAFEAYQEILAEERQPIMINTATHGNRAPTIIDELGRPKCPECGSGLMVRRVPPNQEGVRAQFVCENPRCDVVLDSPYSLEEIIADLRKGSQEDTPE